MKDTHDRKQKSDPLTLVLTTALIAAALGFVVLVADKSQVTSGEVHANAANATGAAAGSGRTSVSGGADATMARTAAAEGRAVGSTPEITSESSESSSSREDNHPASF